MTSCRVLRNWLERTDQPWLLVFDGVQQGQDIEEYIPKGGKGNCVFTSRNPDCLDLSSIDGYECLRIAPFSREDGGAFALTQMPNTIAHSNEACEAAGALSDRMGGLALGLKEMGRSIRRQGCSIAMFLHDFMEKEDEMELFASSGQVQATGYPYSLSTVWSGSMVALDSTSKSFLLMFSLMDPDRIPEIVITSFLKSCREGRLPGLFHTAPTITRCFNILATLVHLGLIERHDGPSTYMIHPLVQSAILHSVSPEIRSIALSAVIDVYLAKHPQSHQSSGTLFTEWHTCALYAPHILRLHRAIAEWKIVPSSNEKLWVLSYNCARYLLEVGAMSESLELVKMTEPYCDAASDEGQLQLSYLHNIRGIIAMQHNLQHDARVLFTQAEAVRKRHLQPFDVNIVAIETNIALTLINEHQWTKLVEYNKPRAASEAAGDMAHTPVPFRSSIYDMLSLAYLETGQLESAWCAIEKSTELLEGFGAVYSQLNGYLHFNRGNILAAQGRFQEALEELRLSLDIRKSILGDHIQTAASAYRLGLLLSKMGQADLALDRLRESLRIYGNLGLFVNYTKRGQARALWRIGKLMKYQGYLADGEGCCKEAESKLKELGGLVGHDACDEDFDNLLNYCES
ncbi:hypothetical protein F4778DRAFT_750353 [Xylariomycetidae sp. FL2044]|nr:hypothetical protein F4778DRAFT_750353 [Xylariomycetidae sp. FL2044]